MSKQQSRDVYLWPVIILYQGLEYVVQSIECVFPITFLSVTTKAPKSQYQFFQRSHFGNHVGEPRKVAAAIVVKTQAPNMRDGVHWQSFVVRGKQHPMDKRGIPYVVGIICNELVFMVQHVVYSDEVHVFSSAVQSDVLEHSRIDNRFKSFAGLCQIEQTLFLLNFGPTSQNHVKLIRCGCWFVGSVIIALENHGQLSNNKLENHRREGIKTMQLWVH